MSPIEREIAIVFLKFDGIDFIVETLWLPVEQGAAFQVEFCLS